MVDSLEAEARRDEDLEGLEGGVGGGDVQREEAGRQRRLDQLLDPVQPALPDGLGQLVGEAVSARRGLLQVGGVNPHRRAAPHQAVVPDIDKEGARMLG